MGKFLISTALFLAQFVHAQELKTLYSEEKVVSTSSSSVVIEPGFKTQYIDISAVSGQFEITDVEVTNQYSDVMDIDNLMGLTGNKASFKNGMIDKTGNPGIAGSVRLYIGVNVTPQKIKISLDKRVAGDASVLVSLLAADMSASASGGAHSIPIIGGGSNAPGPEYIPTIPSQPNQPVVLPEPPVVQTPAPAPVVTKPVVTAPPVVAKPTTPVVTAPPVQQQTPKPAPVVTAPVATAPKPTVTPANQVTCAPTLSTRKNADQLEALLQNMGQLQKNYDSSIPGSSQEANAKLQMTTVRGQIDQLLNDSNWKNYDFRLLEEVLINNTRRYDYSYSGTALEKATLITLEKISIHFVNSVQREVTCGSVNNKTIITLALRYDQREMQTSGKLADAYSKARIVLWKKSLDAFNREMAYMTDYRDPENRGFDFLNSIKGYSSAEAEQAIDQLAIAAFQKSETLFKKQAMLMTGKQRNDEARFYDRMYKKSEQGSLVEVHALNMRAIAAGK